MKLFYALTYAATLSFTLPLISAAQDLADNTATVKNYSMDKGADPVVAGGETPAPKAKQWAQEEDQVNGRISRNNLIKMKNRTDAMISYLQDSCLSESNYSPIWHGEYNSEKTGFGPLMKFGIQCAFDKAHLTIMANDISPLLDHIVVNDKEYLTMVQPAGTKNNCPYFEIPSSTDGATTLSRIWLVSSGNEQPYSIITRKEYLQEAMAEVNNTRNRLIADIKDKTPVRSLSVQEAEKKEAIDQLNSNYSGMDLQVRMKMFQKDYRTDEAYLKENTDKATAGLDSTLHLMGSLLKNLSVRELNKPAVVSVPAVEFEGFEDNLADRKMLIRMNSAYFNPYFSTERPQFFLVQWSFVTDEAAAAGMDKSFLHKFDVTNLKEMLVK